ncbi:AcrR family transcriptional regulator [Rhodococcus sp. 27YEA15]
MNSRVSGPEMDDLILDAARSCVLDVGMQRTTLAEIARRAGVSRPTVYRRWPDTRGVVADLLTREIRDLLPQMRPSGTALSQLVAALGEVTAAIGGHPLFVKIRQTDQALLITYVVDRLGTSQKSILDVITALVQAGHRDGSIRAGDVNEIAAMVLLMAQAVVVSAPTVSDRLSAEAAVEHLRDAVTAYLTPSANSRHEGRS